MPATLRQYKELLVTYLSPQMTSVIWLAILLMLSIVLRLVNPQIISVFIDTATANGRTDQLTMIAVIFIVVVIVTQLLAAIANYLSETVSWTATNLLRADLVLHCLRLDMSFHKEHTPGELIERADGDVAALGAFFSRFVFVVVGNSLLLLGILLVLFFQDWRLGLLLLVFTVVALLILRRVQGVAIPHLRAIRQVRAELSSITEERLSSREDINANGARNYVMEKLQELLQRYLYKQRLGSIMSRTFSSTLEISVALGTAAVLALGAFLFTHGQISIGKVYLAVYFTNILTVNLVGIITQVDQLQSAAASLHRINELYHTQSKIHDGEGKSLPSGSLALQFDNVTFGYKEDKPVLQGISFELRAGQTLGIVGRTGSGKTTISRLLFRSYDPDAGSIYLGGVDICQLRLADLRKRVGLVTQDVQIIQGSIRDNITWFDKTIPDAEIIAVLQSLSLGEWYNSLENGLDTLLGNGGRDLSAGEAQLLAFARVFLQKPDVVVLDEASSRLDPATENMIEHAVSHLLQNCTAIIIAHRLKTIEQVDTVLLLDNGSIEEYGPRALLEASSTSRFSTLLRTSRGGGLL